jgi:hypothetical protein
MNERISQGARPVMSLSVRVRTRVLPLQPIDLSLVVHTLLRRCAHVYGINNINQILGMVFTDYSSNCSYN